MPRKARQFSSTGIYHIILRSVNQQIIFEENADYQKFLFLLEDTKSKYELDIYAYCLMDNHVHLLLKSNQNCLSQCFQSLGTRFARWYNDKYLRFGHLFQDRFHSQPVEDDQYFLTVLMYIHNNPTKAGICQSPSQYAWSSFNAYYSEKNPLIDTVYAFTIAGSKDSLHRFFATFHPDEDELQYYTEHECATPKRNLTDERALEIFRNLTGFSSVTEVSSLSKEKRNETVRLLSKKGLSQNQIARLLDISRATVHRICSI